MAKQLRIDDPELAQKARGADAIIIGGRLFVLVGDAAQGGPGESYLPTSEEAALLREAAADTRPRPTGEDVDAYLAQRRRELGLNG